jgi:molecular chaperone IbpA
MRTHFDWNAYRRATVGFDRLFDFLEQGGTVADNYPPYDVEKVADDRYRITLAVAGFKREEIDITSHQSQLTVAGRRAENDNVEGRKLLHNGIANRAFERRFQLADFVRVDSEVPEAMKPRKIAIGGETPTVIEDQRDAA